MTTATPAPAATSQAASLFKQLGTLLIADVFNSSNTLLEDFFTSLKATPSIQNAMAQGAILAMKAPLQLPNLEAQALAQVADIGLQLTALAKPPAL